VARKLNDCWIGNVVQNRSLRTHYISNTATIRKTAIFIRSTVSSKCQRTAVRFDVLCMQLRNCFRKSDWSLELVGSAVLKIVSMKCSEQSTVFVDSEMTICRVGRGVKFHSLDRHSWIPCIAIAWTQPVHNVIQQTSCHERVLCICIMYVWTYVSSSTKFARQMKAATLQHSFTQQ